MSEFATVPVFDTEQERIEEFAGLDRRVRPAGNAMTDCLNVETGKHPVLSVREPRLKVTLPGVPDGDRVGSLAFNGELLCFVRTHEEQAVDEYGDPVFGTDGRPVTEVTRFLSVGGQEFPLTGDAERSIVFFSAYALVFPDGLWVNTAEQDEDGVYRHGSIRDSHAVTRLQLCGANGRVISPEFSGAYSEDSQPEPDGEPGRETYWLAVKDRVYYLYRYVWDTLVTSAEDGDEEEPEEVPEEEEPHDPNEEPPENHESHYEEPEEEEDRATGAWTLVSECYERLTLDGSDPFLRAGYLIELSGIGSGYDGAREVTAAGDGWCVIPAGDVIYTDNVNVAGSYAYRIPALDCVTVLGGRLWGARYGLQSGENVNEIYGSSVGSFVQWYMMTEVDGEQSPANSVIFNAALPGPFLAAVTYNGCAVFFKRNAMLTVYGSESGGYALESGHAVGLQPGSEKSVTVVNGVLYWKSMTGVYSYDGSGAAMISGALGGDWYSDAVCGGYGDELYCLMTRNGKERELLVYNTVTGMWVRRDAPDADGFCGIGCGVLYRDGADLWADGNGDGVIAVLNGAFGDGELSFGTEGADDIGEQVDGVHWVAAFAPVGYDDDRKRYLLRVNLNMELTLRSRVSVSVRYDDNTEWDTLYELSGEKSLTASLPIRPRRCHVMQLRLEGEGPCRLYSMTRVYKRGGYRNEV